MATAPCGKEAEGPVPACVSVRSRQVGSMVAMVLPLPIILLDTNLALWQRVLGVVGPGTVQGYVRAPPPPSSRLRCALFGRAVQ